MKQWFPLAGVDHTFDTESSCLLQEADKDTPVNKCTLIFQVIEGAENASMIAPARWADLNADGVYVLAF
ncbi:hypothetical protein ES703_110295 [subsurface metagenome]